jgi:membrane-bound lytic murein transglycosylase D
MTSRQVLACICLAAAAAACGGNPRAQVPAPIATPKAVVVEAQPEPPPIDPVSDLITASTRHFEDGERELRLGHLGRARLEFDRAVELVAEAPNGAKSDARLREHYERLIDRIGAYEVLALAEGDGFAEKPSEPAPIDELLATSAFVAPLPSLESIRHTVTADLESTEHDVPIPLNERVLAYVDLFQGRLREWVEAGLQRGTTYLPMIQQVFRAEGLPLDLAYIPLIESAFKPTALSRAKARGVWQFMRGTALENGLKHDWYIDERADPEKATRAAAKYLRTLNRMFDGDWHLALASYNGGPGTVQRAIRRTGEQDFWELSSRPRVLPRETREYVPMILAAIIIARNPAQYGFNVVPMAPVSTDVVTLTRPVDLRRIAEWTGTSIDEIQSLNPELRRWTTPVRTSGYALRVPAGTGGVLEERLAAAPPTEFATLKWHTVKRGDTIATLARRFGVARTDLAEANGLSVKSTLRTGSELLIPRTPAAMATARGGAPAGGAVATAAAAELDHTSYRVKRGDTLSAIARRFGVTVADLKAWNRLSGTKLMPGARLAIRASAGTATTQ